MRTEKSLPKDLALSVSKNKHGIICAFLHGCTPNRVAQLKDWLEHTKSSAGHPMLLPALLAETQYTKHDRIQRRYFKNFLDAFHTIESMALNLSDSTELSGNFMNLNTPRHNARIHTGSGINRQESEEEKPKREAKEQDKKKLDFSRLLNRIFALYQKNGNLQRHLISFHAQLAVMLESIERIGKEALPTEQDYLRDHGDRIRERIVEIRTDYDDLIKQNVLMVEGANLLLTSVRFLTFSSLQP
jgi:hypothetical protein